MPGMNPRIPTTRKVAPTIWVTRRTAELGATVSVPWLSYDDKLTPWSDGGPSVRGPTGDYPAGAVRSPEVSDRGRSDRSPPLTPRANITVQRTDPPFTDRWVRHDAG